MIYKQEFYTQLGRAIALAATLFQDKTDKQGHPYILHCLTVMRNCSPDPEIQVVGVLHDVAEDLSDWPVERLKVELGLTHRQQRALEYLTHDPNESYDNYIKEIAMNLDAKAVKLADLRHNTDILRLKGLRKKDFDRLEKYHRSFVYLSE